MIYKNLAKPTIDLFMFSSKLAELVGWRGPMYLYGWYFLTGILLKYIAPSFGVMAAKKSKLEGIFRGSHSKIVHHSEEIAFFKG